MPSDLVTVQDAIQCLGWDEARLYKGIREGKIRSFGYPPGSEKLLLRRELIERMSPAQKRQIKEQVLLEIEAGKASNDVVQEIGLGVHTLSQWRESDPDFDARIRAAVES